MGQIGIGRIKRGASAQRGSRRDVRRREPRKEKISQILTCGLQAHPRRVAEAAGDIVLVAGIPRSTSARHPVRPEVPEGMTPDRRRRAHAHR